MVTQNASLPHRMIRAAQLDSQLYEEVERDTSATTQAAIVVIIAAVAAGIGEFFREGGGAALGGVLGAFVGWIVWSYTTYYIGTTILKGAATRATPGEMLRTIGFSHSIGVLNVLRFIPVLGPLIGFIIAIWQLVASVVAVRQGLDVSTGRAIAVVVVGWLLYVLITVILIAIFESIF